MDDIRALEGTIEVLSDPEALSSLIASEREIAQGETVSEQDLNDAMASRARRAR